MPVLYHPEFVSLFGLDARAALVLSQLIYWNRPSRSGGTKLTLRRNGKPCVAKTRQQLAAETGLTPRQIKTAIERLRRTGLVSGEQHLFGGRNMNHFHLDEVRLGRFMHGPPGSVGATSRGHSEPVRTARPDGRTKSTRVDPAHQTGWAPTAHSSSTEITAEITEEITAVAACAAAAIRPADDTVGSERRERIEREADDQKAGAEVQP